MEDLLDEIWSIHCRWDHLDYPESLADKADVISELIGEFYQAVGEIE